VTVDEVSKSDMSHMATIRQVGRTCLVGGEPARKSARA